MTRETRPEQVLSLLKAEALPPPVIFLYGPEAYTRNRLIEQIIDLFIPDEKARVFGLEDMEAPDVEPAHLLGLLKTVPFGLSRKVVVLRRFELAATAVKKGEKTKEGGAGDARIGKGTTPFEEGLIRYFARPSPKSLLLISSSRELKKSHPFTKALPRRTLLVPCLGLKGRQSVAFVKQRLKELGKSAPEAWVEQFVEICGSEAQRLSGELEKVALHAGDRSVLGEEDLAVVSPGEFSRDVFALLDAVAGGKPDMAMEIMREIAGSGEPPLRILSVILWHYRLLARAKRLASHGSEGGAMRIHPSRFVSRKITRHAQGLSEEGLAAAFRLLQTTDVRLKGSRLPPTQILEGLVYSLSKQTTRGGR